MCKTSGVTLDWSFPLLEALVLHRVSLILTIQVHKQVAILISARPTKRAVVAVLAGEKEESLESPARIVKSKV